jgi:hypothetical protein
VHAMGLSHAPLMDLAVLFCSVELCCICLKAKMRFGTAVLLKAGMNVLQISVDRREREGA